MSITVRPIESTADIKRFLRVQKELLGDDPNFRYALEMERMDALNPKKNPYFAHADVQLFLAEENGKAVGRISAQVDHLAQEKWGPNLGHFGFFDARDQHVANTLLDTVEEWARQKGMTRLQGPWSLNANMEMGMLIDGFDTPPFLFMAHGKPEYPEWLEARGYTKAHDAFAYGLNLLEGFPEKALRVVKLAEKNKKFTLRELDMKNYDRDINQILEIFNDAWQDNWGYVPFTKEEGEHMAKELKLIIKPYRTVITEVDGEIAGFMITIPDLNHLVRDLDGRLFPFGVFKLLTRMLRDDCPRMRVPLMGVKKKFQRGISGGALAMWMIDYSTKGVLKRGAEFGELSWILESNDSMNGILEQIGCYKYKTYRVFERSLA